MTMKRGNWSSRLGFILATSGAAVGLGNIQRFPYMTAKCGGSIFVLIYILCVLFIAFPLMLVEFSIGRHTQRNPVCAIEKIKPKSTWKLAGALGIFVAFFILTYYQVVAAWSIGYIFKSFSNAAVDLNNFTSNAYVVIAYMALFMLCVIGIVSRGVKRGIEKFSKVLMPLLLFLIIFLMVRSLMLPNSSLGLKYYLEPSMSHFNGKILLYAISQAFFSLCIGEAVLITYGSYAPKNENLVGSAVYIALFDTVIAILSGLIIFPAIFSFGMQPDQGVGLTFVVLPKVFQKMFLGQIFGAAFFLLLTFAALTTAIALLEIPVVYLIDAKKWKRKKAVWLVGGAAFLLGIPSALSKGANSFLSNMKFLSQTSFYDIMDFIWGGLGMVIGGFLLSIFAGWVWKAKNAADELHIGCKHFRLFSSLWRFIIKFLAPIFIALIFLFLIVNN